ncbi:MAG: NUDIX hydrolase [Stellaceae bacterium]
MATAFRSPPVPVPRAEARGAALAIRLSAVILAATTDEPRVLTLRLGQEPFEALPSGPLEIEHRTLEIGLRAWVERQTSQKLGYVEQLYTFGDRDRTESEEPRPGRALTVAYLALVREARTEGAAEAEWHSWYRHFPWEDWRTGKPAALFPLEERLARWAENAAGEVERRLRLERLSLAFAASWNEERVLDRYELLYEAGLIPEAWRGRGRSPPPSDGPVFGVPMAADHRRVLATAIGRLRGKIKYRPVVFELMPPVFTLLQLQRTVEALSGVRLHKQNFRRLVEQQGLVEETGGISAETGGRPARLVRFRREVLLERPAPGLRLRPGRRAPGL